MVICSQCFSLLRFNIHVRIYIFMIFFFSLYVFLVFRIFVSWSRGSGKGNIKKVYAVEKGLSLSRTRVSLIVHDGTRFARRERTIIVSATARRRFGLNAQVYHFFFFFLFLSFLFRRWHYYLPTKEQKSGLLDIWHRLNGIFCPRVLSRATRTLLLNRMTRCFSSCCLLFFLSFCYVSKLGSRETIVIFLFTWLFRLGAS